MRVAIQIVPRTTRIIMRKNEREAASMLKRSELPPLTRMLAAMRTAEHKNAPVQKPTGISFERLMTRTRCSPFSRAMPGN